ncbi:hypothetical protein CYMTET_22831 [Cymbomonas tetramitiformis]|uniref:Protein kinase domain-containing protein n=1 Tax=Cymbomonas tetramitiformis TaxID=36881 RepID=A0AAE0L1Q5_9CHLO|nr:hypothetical protein CYMTET_22831 [Cymbomonas tetramitiformis]
MTRDKVIAEELGPEWTYKRPLGQGAYGSVHLFEEKSTGLVFAVKFIQRASVDEMVSREVLNHSSLRQEHIARFKRTLVTKAGDLAIIMEFASGGDLFAFVTESPGANLPEDMARGYFQQLISGIDYMHSQGICHRDLKLENMLMTGDPPVIKICDFGFSKNNKLNSNPKTKVGTPAYVPPEILMPKQEQAYDGRAADIWSCGVALHIMLVGMFPFCDPSEPNNDRKTLLNIVQYGKGQAPYKPPLYASSECRALLSSMLDPDPARRATAEAIKATSWFRTNLAPNLLLETGQEKEAGSQTSEEVLAVLEEVKKPLSFTDSWANAQAMPNDYDSDQDSLGSELNSPMPSFNFEAGSGSDLGELKSLSPTKSGPSPLKGPQEGGAAGDLEVSDTKKKPAETAETKPAETAETKPAEAAEPKSADAAEPKSAGVRFAANPVGFITDKIKGFLP